MPNWYGLADIHGERICFRGYFTLGNGIFSYCLRFPLFSVGAEHHDPKKGTIRLRCIFCAIGSICSIMWVVSSAFRLGKKDSKNLSKNLSLFRLFVIFPFRYFATFPFRCLAILPLFHFAVFHFAILPFSHFAVLPFRQ